MCQHVLLKLYWGIICTRLSSFIEKFQENRSSIFINRSFDSPLLGLIPLLPESSAVASCELPSSKTKTGRRPPCCSQHLSGLCLESGGDPPPPPQGADVPGKHLSHLSQNPRSRSPEEPWGQLLSPLASSRAPPATLRLWAEAGVWVLCRQLCFLPVHTDLPQDFVSQGPSP